MSIAKSRCFIFMFHFFWCYLVMVLCFCISYRRMDAYEFRWINVIARPIESRSCPLKKCPLPIFSSSMRPNMGSWAIFGVPFRIPTNNPLLPPTLTSNLFFFPPKTNKTIEEKSTLDNSNFLFPNIFCFRSIELIASQKTESRQLCTSKIDNIVATTPCTLHTIYCNGILFLFIQW